MNKYELWPANTENASRNYETYVNKVMFVKLQELKLGTQATIPNF